MTETVSHTLKSIVELQVLAPDQAQLVADAATAFTNQRDLARALAERKLLTPFQANRVAQGRASELRLGPFVLLDRVGKGGMGEVFKARHPLMDRVVALKVLRADRRGGEQTLERFLREIT